MTTPPETLDQRAERLYNAMLEALGTGGAEGMSGTSDDALKDLAEKIAREY